MKNTLSSLILAAISLVGFVQSGSNQALFATLFFVGVSFICNSIEGRKDDE